MQSDLQTAPASQWMVWTGRILSALSAAFLLLDGVMKLFKPTVVMEATAQLEYREQVVIPLGIVLITCSVLYLIPQTAVLGAILLTGYLGGAVASHVRVGHPTFETLFPVIFGAILWGGLFLRDQRLRALIPWRR